MRKPMGYTLHNELVRSFVLGFRHMKHQIAVEHISCELPEIVFGLAIQLFSR